MRFAFITDELPRPGVAGHLAMNHAIITWLRDLGHEVTVLLPRPRLHQLISRSDAAVAGIGLGFLRGYVYPASPAALLASIGRILRRHLPIKARGDDAVLGAFITPAHVAWCHRQLLALAPDAVFADTIFRAPVLLGAAATRKVIIAHDVFHRRHRALRNAGYRVHPPELTQASEAGLLNLADIIAAIQPAEAAEMRAMCPGKTVIVAPMPALPCRRPQTTARIPARLVFVGSATLPNLDGLRWFFAEIWPALIEVPEISLDLAGDCGAALENLPPRVRRLGRVRDLSPVLHRAALAISPLRVGSGLKIKLLDYARHGLITVATPESLEGFAADHAPFIPAGDAKGFAEAVLAYLREDAPAGEAQALDYVARHYSVNASFGALAAALHL